MLGELYIKLISSKLIQKLLGGFSAPESAASTSREQAEIYHIA
jgi:hypothetical protein